MEKMRKFILLAMILFALTMQSKNKYGMLYNRIDSLMSSIFLDDAPGAALLIADGDKVIFDKGYGIADMEKHEHIDGNTIFNIASVTKQFTVAGILKLQEMGLLSVEDSVAKFFPEFHGEMWKRVRIRHLMSHSSGVPDLRSRADQKKNLYITDEQCLEYMVNLDSLKFAPGTAYDYVNPTFQILYAIIERVSGMKFVDFQRKYLFDKAGMSSARYFSPDMPMEHVAHGYIIPNGAAPKDIDCDAHKQRNVERNIFTDLHGNQWAKWDYGEETFFATKADGGLYCSIHDFLRWERALANNKCISEQSKLSAYTPHIMVSGSPYCTYQNRPDAWYGYGWFIDTTPGLPVKIYHTGDNGGFQAYAAKFRDSKITITLFANRNDIDRWKLALDIERILREEGELR
jgi:CubicO group peptidase (beta-lactamase class C family)